MCTLCRPRLSRRLPDVVIAGAKKCGTTALLSLLNLHPQVRGLMSQEPHYYDRHFDLGPEWYLRQMPRVAPWQLLVEKTPKYFITPRAPGEIYKVCQRKKGGDGVEAGVLNFCRIIWHVEGSALASLTHQFP